MEQEQTLVAPHNAIGQTLSVPLPDGSAFAATVPDDRTLNVPAGAAAELLRLPGWQAMNETTAARLKDEAKVLASPGVAPVRARRDQIAAREASLRTIAAEAAAHLAEVEGKLAAAKAAFATSTATVRDVTAAQQAVDQARAELATAQEGLHACAVELQRAHGDVGREITLRLRAAHEKSAEPIRQEAAVLVVELEAQLAGLRELLRRRAALCRRVARDFPLAESIGPLSSTELAGIFYRATARAGTGQAPPADTAPRYVQLARDLLLGLGGGGDAAYADELGVKV